MTLNILWWVAFFVFGLALQQALPGTDVLVAGLFLALQERRPFSLPWCCSRSSSFRKAWARWISARPFSGTFWS